MENTGEAAEPNPTNTNTSTLFPSFSMLACVHLRLDELVHPAIAPHAKVFLHEIGGSLKQAIELALWQHTPPSLDANGCHPKAAAILPHATINSDIAWEERLGGGAMVVRSDSRRVSLNT